MAQQSDIIAIDMPSAGIIMQLMPCSVISQVMWHIIGDIMAIDIWLGIDMGICIFIAWFMVELLG